MLSYSFVVRRVYLSYYCFPISSKQTVHSPLISGLNKVFSPTRPIRCNSLVVWENPIRSAVSKILLQAHQAPKPMPSPCSFKVSDSESGILKLS